jgi:hypothetical protein
VFKKTFLVALAFFACVACMAWVKRPQRPSVARALSKSELLALVAGQTLPENIVYEIRTHGLLFAPSAAYQTLLTGAGPRIMAALHEAKIATGMPSEPADDSALLTPQHRRTNVEDRQARRCNE